MLPAGDGHHNLHGWWMRHVSKHAVHVPGVDLATRGKIMDAGLGMRIACPYMT